MTHSGAIFCHVIKIVQFIHDIFSKISGNQKWKGGTPSLIIILNNKPILINSSPIMGEIIIEEFNNTEISISIDPKL